MSGSRRDKNYLQGKGVRIRMGSRTKAPHCWIFIGAFVSCFGCSREWFKHALVCAQFAALTTRATRCWQKASRTIEFYASRMGAYAQIRMHVCRHAACQRNNIEASLMSTRRTVASA
eukprot:6210241-Pleurochrysis_carterae.AAC.1